MFDKLYLLFCLRCAQTTGDNATTELEAAAATGEGRQILEQGEFTGFADLAWLQIDQPADHSASEANVNLIH